MNEIEQFKQDFPEVYVSTELVMKLGALFANPLRFNTLTVQEITKIFDSLQSSIDTAEKFWRLSKLKQEKSREENSTDKSTFVDLSDFIG